MSYNCFIKSRSAFLLLFGSRMTSGFLCGPPPSHQQEEAFASTTMRWKCLRSHKPDAWIKRHKLSLHCMSRHESVWNKTSKPTYGGHLSLWRAYTLGNEWSAQMFSESNLNCKVKRNTVCIQREKRGWRKECEMSLQMGITPQPLWHIPMPVSVIRLLLCSCRNLWNHHVALKLHTTSKPSHLGWLIQFRKQ